MLSMLPRTRSCFVCGLDNPVGLHLGFMVDGENVVARFKAAPEHVGFPNIVHGGLIATVLDEAMVWACGVRAKQFAYCAELTVRYHHTVPAGEEVRVIGTMTANRRNRLFEARAEIVSSNGKVLASGTGKYLPVPEELTDVMQSDFVGDIGRIIGR